MNGDYIDEIESEAVKEDVKAEKGSKTTLMAVIAGLAIIAIGVAVYVFYFRTKNNESLESEPADGEPAENEGGHRETKLLKEDEW